MTDKEYQQQKRECWMDLALDAANMNKVTIEEYKRIFNGVFDTAYALGREKEAISQEEIEKAALEYVLTRQLARHNAKKEEDATMRDFDKTIKAWDAYDMEQAFEYGANYALGKQKKDAEDDRTLKVNRQLFCRLCADADDYINEHLEEEDSDYVYYQGRSDALHELYRGECKDVEDTVIHLISDAEGEDEMLTCNKERVCKFYAHLLDMVENERMNEHYPEWCDLESEYIALFGEMVFIEYFGTKNHPDDEPNPAELSAAHPDRLHIATQLLAGLLASSKEKHPVSRAVALADALIAECEKGDAE